MCQLSPRYENERRAIISGSRCYEQYCTYVGIYMCVLTAKSLWLLLFVFRAIMARIQVLEMAREDRWNRLRNGLCCDSFEKKKVDSTLPPSPSYEHGRRICTSKSSINRLIFKRLGLLFVQKARSRGGWIWNM